MENLKNTVYDLVCGCKDKQCARRRAVDRLVEAAKEEGAREERERMRLAEQESVYPIHTFDIKGPLRTIKLTNNYKKMSKRLIIEDFGQQIEDQEEKALAFLREFKKRPSEFIGGILFAFADYIMDSDSMQANLEVEGEIHGEKCRVNMNTIITKLQPNRRDDEAH